MSFQKQVSSLRLAILCLLSQAPRSGYDLKRTFETTPMGHFSASPGAIYPALKSMDKEGWVCGEMSAQGQSRTARLLSLTPAGIDELRQYFLQPLTLDDVLFRKDQIMLRFAFMTPIAGRKATCGFLQQLTTLLDDHVENLKSAAQALQNDPLEGVLALQQGIDSFETDLQWARKAFTTLTNNQQEIS